MCWMNQQTPLRGAELLLGLDLHGDVRVDPEGVVDAEWPAGEANHDGEHGREGVVFSDRFRGQLVGNEPGDRIEESDHEVPLPAGQTHAENEQDTGDAHEAIEAVLQVDPSGLVDDAVEVEMGQHGDDDHEGT